MDIKVHQEHRVVPLSMELEIVKAFEVDLVRIVDLAKMYGISRQGMYKLLKRNGVDTTKSGENAWHEVSCRTCGAIIKRRRATLRNQENHYCNNKCYYRHLGSISIGVVTSRAGMYMARSIVSLFYEYKGGEVVHHIDGDETNNKLSNLAIFKCNGDHLLFHRGYNTLPIWTGKQYMRDHPEVDQSLVDRLMKKKKNKLKIDKTENDILNGKVKIIEETGQ